MRTRHTLVLASRFLLAAGFGVLGVTTWAPSASAQAEPSKADRNAARKAYADGTEAFKREDYAGALQKFEKANSLIPSPNAQYWIANCLDQLGRSDDAAEAYRKALADPEVDKLGEEKISHARARLSALAGGGDSEPSDESEEPTEEPAGEEEVPEEEEEAPEPVPPPEPEPKEDLGPTANMAEFGVFGGMLFMSDSHNLHEPPGHRFAHYDNVSWMLGLRGAYFPLSFLGVELEYEHGWGGVGKPLDRSRTRPFASADLNSFRGQVIGQIPVGRFVPFALLGAGLLHGVSRRLGNDTDFMVRGGLGAKVAVHEFIAPRLDIGFNVSQKRGGSMWDGVAVHPEVLLGVSATLGR